MKPAVLRPQALRDQQGEARYFRGEAGTRVAVRLVKATNAALDQIELEPGIGSPVLGSRLGIPGLRTWQVKGLPLLWFYFERDDHLDVVRLLGERQDVAAILGAEFTANRSHNASDRQRLRVARLQPDDRPDSPPADVRCSALDALQRTLTV